MPMTITALNLTILTVNKQLGSLVSSNRPSGSGSFGFSSKMSGCSFGTGALDIPPAIRRRNNVLITSHIVHLLSQGDDLIIAERVLKMEFEIENVDADGRPIPDLSNVRLPDDLNDMICGIILEHYRKELVS